MTVLGSVEQWAGSDQPQRLFEFARFSRSRSRPMVSLAQLEGRKCASQKLLSGPGRCGWRFDRLTTTILAG